MDIDFFRARGYQIFPRALDANVVAGMRTFLEGELRSSVEMVRASLGVGDPKDFRVLVASLTESGAFAQLDHEMQQILSGHFAAKTRLSSHLWAIPEQPAVREILQAVFQDNRLFMHMPPAARWVLPGHGQSAVPAHQDVSYNKHMSDFVTLWVPLVAIDDDCGGVAIFEGSHEPRERATAKSDRFWLEAVRTEGFPRVHHAMEPGDVLLLNKWIVHESMPNRSNRIRFSVDYRYFCSRHHSSKHYLDLQALQVVAPGAAAPQ